MIILVRHGETALNAAHVVQPEDTPLNARGLQQAELVAARLVELGAAQVLCSDLPRARMTAEPIIRATGAPVQHDASLQERNFGDLRGRSYAELNQDIFAADYIPPNGESWPQFDARVARAWSLITQGASALEGNLVVVTHGLVCRSIAHQFLRFERGQEPPRSWGNTSVTICARVAPHTVELLNCTTHLSALTSADPNAISGI
jgi:broad specificity phosphatase PhoE